MASTAIAPVEQYAPITFDNGVSNETPVTESALAAAPAATLDNVVSIDTGANASTETAPDAPVAPTVTLFQDPLSQRIIGLWGGYRRDRKSLGSALEEQQRTLDPGKFAEFLRYAGIPRACAYRFIKGFKLYMTLPSELCALAEADRIDLCKPSVQKAIEATDFAFELGEWDSDRRKEFLAELRAATKPRRSSNSPKLEPIDRIKRDVRKYLDVDESPLEFAKTLCEWLGGVVIEYASAASDAAESDPVA